MSDFVPLQQARGLIRPNGKPVARHTLLSMGVRGVLDVRDVAGRFVVTRDSINSYNKRQAAGPPR